MDADLQNDGGYPQAAGEDGWGYDVVSGWRKHRMTTELTRVLPSQIANALISWATGVRLHDYGCSLRPIAPTCCAIYTSMARCRFIPALAYWAGAT